MNVSRTGLKKVVGRRLAARVLKSWIEDFVDEDTGEVVSIERNEIIVDRETVLEPEHIDAIVESGAKTIGAARRGYCPRCDRQVVLL